MCESIRKSEAAAILLLLETEEKSCDFLGFFCVDKQRSVIRCWRAPLPNKIITITGVPLGRIWQICRNSPRTFDGCTARHLRRMSRIRDWKKRQKKDGEPCASRLSATAVNDGTE